MWGVVEDREENGTFIAYHVVPMVEIDGDSIPSGAHIMSDSCPCHPFLSHGEGGWDIWNHFDPAAPGGLSMHEWNRQKLEAQGKMLN